MKDDLDLAGLGSRAFGGEGFELGKPVSEDVFVLGYSARVVRALKGRGGGDGDGLDGPLSSVSMSPCMTRRGNILRLLRGAVDATARVVAPIWRGAAVGSRRYLARLKPEGQMFSLEIKGLLLTLRL